VEPDERARLPKAGHGKRKVRGSDGSVRTDRRWRTDASLTFFRENVTDAVETDWNHAGFSPLDLELGRTKEGQYGSHGGIAAGRSEWEGQTPSRALHFRCFRSLGRG